MQPKLILTPFGDDANPATINEIPEAPRPSDEPQQATWSTGFPLVTMTFPGAGGLPPFGQDMNGVLYAISAHAAFSGSGGQYKWSSEYVSAKGGYFKGAVLQSDDGLSAYVSTIDGNSLNFNLDPSSIGNQWQIYSGPPSFASLSGKPTTLAGYGITNAYTKLESNARYPLAVNVYTRGEADTVFAFSWDVYTKAESDFRFPLAVNVYTRSQADTVFAFSWDVYTIAQTNTRLALKPDSVAISAVGFASNNPQLPFMRRASDGVDYYLQRADDRKWENVTAARFAGVSYTNSTGRAIELFIRLDPLDNSTVLYIGNIAVQIYDSNQEFLSITIPNGTGYLISTWGSATPMLWLELR